MEEDLHLLRRDMKLTSAPKRAALELLRRKIEEASERVRNARSARSAAAAALEQADAAVAAEEAAKAALVRDMNALIFQSSMQQMKALEELQTRMDSLAAKVVPGADAEAAVLLAVPSTPRGPEQSGNKEVQAARAEMEAAAAVAEAEAAEARSRHVPLRKATPATSDAGTPPAVRTLKPAAISQPRVTSAHGGGSFTGFAVE